MIVVQLLYVLLGVLFLIFRDVLGLLDLADRIGARVADRHPIERHLAAVGVHAHQVQQRRRGLACAHGRELALHCFYGLVHRQLRVLDVIREERGGGGHWTIVPTRSPARTLAVAPGWLMLNTTMGSLFSLQRPKAFASITA